MDASLIAKLLTSTEVPLLPNAAVMWLNLYAGWSIVLLSGFLLIAGKLVPGLRWSLSFLLMMWTLWPGTASPAYWLGLAFQSPSLASLIICLGGILQIERRRQGRSDFLLEPDLRALRMLSALSIILGWLLLLDTMALLPFSIYAWGFGSNGFAVAIAFAALLWVALPSLASAVPLLVLTLFALSRLPTGNVWDALLDPWLWLVLQVGWLVSVVRHFWTAKSLSPATRA
jgi:hypothetical protein